MIPLGAGPLNLKDFQDVIQLVSINNIDLKSEHFRDLFMKYGNSDLYAKICRACEQERSMSFWKELAAVAQISRPRHINVGEAIIDHS